MVEWLAFYSDENSTYNIPQSLLELPGIDAARVIDVEFFEGVVRLLDVLLREHHGLSLDCLSLPTPACDSSRQRIPLAVTTNLGSFTTSNGC